MAQQDTALNEMLRGTMPTLVEIYATWSNASNMMMPVIGQLQAEFNGKINVVQFSYDFNNSGIECTPAEVPLLLLYRSGQPVWRSAGREVSLEELRKAVEEKGGVTPSEWL